MTGIKKFALVFSIVLSLLMPPSPGHALDGPAGSSSSPGAEMILFAEIPSVFGASKYDQKVTEAPSSVSIVTASEIKKYGYRTLSNILRSVRSFYISNDRSYDYIGVRGFSRPEDYNTRVLILIDGHRTNDNIYDASSSETVFSIDVDLIDRVEIIRGPSSSLYGTNAFFAVVNVITKNGRDYQGVEISGEAASHETFDGRLTCGRRFGNGLELLISGTASDSDGPDWHYSEFDDPETNNGLAEGRDWERFQNAFLKASVSDFTLTGAYNKRRDGIPTAPWGVVFNDNTWTLDETAYLDVKYDHSLENGWDILARAYYDYYRYEGEYPYDWAEEGDPPEIYVGKDEAEGNWWGAEIQFSKRLHEKHKLVIGIEYVDNFKQDQFYYDDKDDPSSLVLDAPNDSEIWAVFLQDEFQILDELILNAGVRHDHYSTFGSTTNPRLALIYSPLEKTTLKLLYGSAFRAPNAYELYYHDGELTTGANPDLDAETIDTWEAILEQCITERLRGVATGFYYKIDDLINQMEDPARVSRETGEPLLVFENLDQAEAWGLELELEARMENGIKGRISYTFQETEDQETGKILSNSPRHLFKLNLIVPVFEERIFLGIEEQYTGTRKTLSGGDTGGFAVTNTTLFTRNLLDGLEMSGSVYNLFDKKFSDPGSGEHEQDAIEQEGRTFRFKLTYIF